MASCRLDGSDRRNAIIDAALPLFARKGLTATTTREIAAAAGVSEALIFKHFPSKSALYEAIVLSCVDEDPELERLTTLPPGTATVIQYVHSLVRYFVLTLPEEPLDRSRHRLLVMSLLEDGEFARQLFNWVGRAIDPAFAAAIAVAEAAGDMVPAPLAAGYRLRPALWMVQMIAALNLPETPADCLPGGRAEFASQVTWFILRGIGLRDAVIANHWVLADLPPPDPAPPEGRGSEGQPSDDSHLRAPPVINALM